MLQTAQASLQSVERTPGFQPMSSFRHKTVHASLRYINGFMDYDAAGLLLQALQCLMPHPIPQNHSTSTLSLGLTLLRAYPSASLHSHPIPRPRCQLGTAIKGLGAAGRVLAVQYHR